MPNDKIPEFTRWFRKLLLGAKSCFERDVLRFCRPQLEARYIAQVMAWPDLPAEGALMSYNKNTMVVWPNNAAEEAASTEEEIYYA